MYFMKQKSFHFFSFNIDMILFSDLITRFFNYFTSLTSLLIFKLKDFQSLFYTLGTHS